MIAEHRTRSNIGIAAGFVVQWAGLGAANSLPGSVPAIVVVTGLGLFLWGCTEYCRAKGQSPLLGLLGLASILGLLVLVLLPDHEKNV